MHFEKNALTIIEPDLEASVVLVLPYMDYFPANDLVEEVDAVFPRPPVIRWKAEAAKLRLQARPDEEFLVFLLKSKDHLVFVLAIALFYD